MEFSHFVEWTFYGIVGAGVTFIASAIWSIKTTLNVLVEKSQWHERWLERHDDELKELRGHSK
jgi:hypothetical protein